MFMTDIHTHWLYTQSTVKDLFSTAQKSCDFEVLVHLYGIYLCESDTVSS